MYIGTTIIGYTISKTKMLSKELELLEAINKRQTAAEISPPTGISGIVTEGDDLGCLSANNSVERNGPWALPWLGPAFPSRIVQPKQLVVHPRVVAECMWALKQWVQCTV
jgi:hypothetical protein